PERSPSGPVIFTAAPGTTDPLESTTDPEIDPVVEVSCAKTAVAASITNSVKSKLKIFFIFALPFLRLIHEYLPVVAVERRSKIIFLNTPMAHDRISLRNAQRVCRAPI